MAAWDVDNAGLAVVLRSYDVFAASDRRSAQSADPRLTFDQVGGPPVMWNDAEWLDSVRGR